MNVYQFDIKNNIKDVNFFKKGTILLLGEFEFFHKGHFKLFEKAKKINNDNKIGILIVDKPEKKYLQSKQIKLESFAKLGFDFAINCDFNFEFKSLDGMDFINYLDKNFNVHHYVVGQDFHFGKNRKYDSNTLKEITKANVEIIEIESYNKIKISSSEINQMFEFGEINLINQLIVNPIEIEIKIDQQKILWLIDLKPHFGIYSFQILIDDYWYSGLIHFSIKNEINFKLINFKNEFIFDQKSRIKFLQTNRIIVNSRFDAIEQDDIDVTKQFFSI